MTWLRMDDNMLDHPKWRRAIRLGGDEVVAIWFRLTSWCSRHLTDGVVPADMVAIVAEVRSEARSRPLRALADAGLIERSHDGELIVSGYLERNPSREDVLKSREAATARKEKHRLTAGGTPPSQRGSPSPERPAATPHPNPIPIPSRPTPEGAEAAAPTPAQGQRQVWFNLDGWEIPPELVTEAEIAGLKPGRLEARVDELRGGPIGGRRGTFDRTDYVRKLIPKWRTWDENDAAARLGAAPRAGPKRHGSAQEDHGIDPFAKFEETQPCR